MKNITASTNITRTANGGGSWSCRICGYTHKSHGVVLDHAAGHVIKAYLKILAIVCIFK